MVLSDRDIQAALAENALEIRSPRDLRYQPASLDVHVARTIVVFNGVNNRPIDLRMPTDDFSRYQTIDDSGLVMQPREFLLGVTVEWFSLSGTLLANIEGKSSLGRLGLIVHVTAGFIDPGFSGHVTLEMVNLNAHPIIIYPGMPVGQIRFSRLQSAPTHMYGEVALGSKGYKNHYSDDPKPIYSQYWKNFA